MILDTSDKTNSAWLKQVIHSGKCELNTSKPGLLFRKFPTSRNLVPATCDAPCCGSAKPNFLARRLSKADAAAADCSSSPTQNSIQQIRSTCRHPAVSLKAYTDFRTFPSVSARCRSSPPPSPPCTATIVSLYRSREGFIVPTFGHGFFAAI